MKRLLFLLAVAATTATACGASAATPTPTPATPSPTLGTRPATPVKITLISPANGEVVHGNTVHVAVSISGGTISPVTSTHISPTLGHVHLYFNNELVYMAYTLQEDFPVHPGLQYAMYAEFVAQDHFPFSPRDITPTIFFTVAA